MDSPLVMKHDALRFSNQELALLSRLTTPWAAAAITEQVVRIQLEDGTGIAITSEGVDVARFFECFRLAVDTCKEEVIGERPAAFRAGAQTIRILQAEEWLIGEHYPPKIWLATISVPTVLACRAVHRPTHGIAAPLSLEFCL